MVQPRITFAWGTTALANVPVYPHLTHDPRFQQYLGMFFAGWANIELLTSYLIGKLLKITDEEAHVVTSGMMFGTKARLLRNLLYRSNHPNKAVLTGALNQIQNSSKRDAFAHSFILSGPHVVTFIERPGHGDYQAKPHSYSLDEFLQHVRGVTAAMMEFQAGLAVPVEELSEFANAAFKADLKANKTPKPPKDKA
jgi:hypothetical protein